MRKVNCPGVRVLTVIILSNLPWIYSNAGAETVADLMERGRQYYQSGNYQAALEEFRAATEIDPGYLKGWENMGWAYWKMGQLDRTLEIWNSLRAIHPERFRLLNMIAEAHTAKGEYGQALVVYQESLEEKSGQVDVLAARCKVLYWAGLYNDAVKYCGGFLSSYPEHDEIRLLLAKLQMSSQIADYQAAIDNFQQLVGKKPNDLQLQIELAKAYYRNESYEKAFETARLVSQQDSENVPVREILLNSAIRMQDYERAQDAVAELQAVDPNHPDITAGRAKIHNGMALRFYRAGDYDNALKEFLSARALSPELPRLQENIGWTYQHLGQIDQAIRVWEELLETQPGEVHILNLLARAYTAKRVYDNALLMYDKSLKIDPLQMEARFAKAKIKRWIGSYQESADELSKLVVEYPDNVAIRYQLARCLMRLQRYDEAVEHYKKLTSAEPDDSRYSMEMARALYLCEDYPGALKLAGNVLAKDPCNLDALNFLADDAEFLGDFEKACQILETAVTIDGDNISCMNRLAVCAAAIDDYPLVEKVTDKSLKLLAAQPAIRLLYADSLRTNGNLTEAAKQYRWILKCNPNHIPALVGLKQCCVDKKDYKGGLVYLEQVLSIDKTNIYLMLDKAMLLAYAGEYGKSVGLLEDLLEKVKTREAVLILLYHGLSKNQRSNILRLSNFKAQMEVLSNLGYSAVTTEDLVRAWKGERKLPRRSVLITFDDARRDSFKYADSVLQDLSFKATMFAPVCIVDAKDPMFSDWRQIQHYAGTGRWEIQSHGNFAHRDIVINTAGERGTFLTHRQWLEDENRLESNREYYQRIDTDYRESGEILEEHLNTKVNAFAFPKGKFGQEECACAGSVISNLIAVRKYFALSFFQNRYGFNLAGDDPYLLKRLEVPEIWTAQHLRDHITGNDPVRLVSFNLANVYRWAGQNYKAVCLYDKLLEDNPLDKDVLLGKAIACRSSGRFFEARAVLDRVLIQDGSNQIILEQRERADRLTAPALDNFFSYFQDEDERRRLKWGTSLQLPYSDELTIETSLATAELEDKNVSRVRENEGSLSALYRQGEARYDLSYTFRDFSGADDAHNYSLTAGMPLFFDNVTLTHAYRSEETARAVIQGTKYHENAVSISKALNDRLSTFSKYRRSDFTDENSRNTFRINGLYRFLNQPRLSAGCELVLDDTDFYSPVYYTPDGLKIIQALFRADGRMFEYLNYNLRYAVGHARERNSSDKIVQNGSMSLGIRSGNSLELGLLLAFSDTPTYGSEYVLVDLKYRF